MSKKRRTTSQPVTAPSPPWLWIGASVAVYCAFALAFSFLMGGLIGDEGFYSLSARNVMDGMRLYRDFLISQMPLLSYVYAGWFSLVGVSIESGRILSASMGAASVGLIALTCHRRGGVIAGIVGGLLVGCNLHFIGDTLTIKTQSLTVFLTSCSIFVLAKKNPQKPLLQAAIAMFFMTLAFLGRLSILPALLLVWLYLGWRNRGALRMFMAIALVNLAVIAAILAYFYSDGNMIFCVYTFHQEYAQFMPWTLERLSLTVCDWLNNELTIIFLFTCANWFFLTRFNESRRSLSDRLDDLLFPAFLLLSYWGATTLHWINAQSYATHQTSIIAFAVTFSAIALAPVFQALVTANKSVAVFAFASAIILPLIHANGLTLGLLSGGNRAVAALHEAVSIIGRHAKKEDSILSFSTELAVEGGYKVPRGYEMSEFTYFPQMSDERCARLKTTNLRKLKADIASGQHKIFAVEDRLFGLMACGNPDVARQLNELVSSRYEQVGTVPRYGQFGLTMHIFALKKSL